MIMRIAKSWDDESSLQVDIFRWATWLLLRQNAVLAIKRCALKTLACKPQTIHECLRFGTLWGEPNSAEYERGGREHEEYEKRSLHGLRSLPDMQAVRDV
jgi:hypothetical protein